MRDKRAPGEPETQDPEDGKRWDDVEEATELILEKRFEAALTELKRVLDADHRNGYAFNLLGDVLYEMERLEPAHDAYKAATLVAPNFLGARVSLSHVLRKLRDPEGAEREARIAVSKFPGDGEAMHALGLALASRGKRKDARRSLEGFLATNPDFESATEVRGVLEMLGLGNEDDPLDIEDE